MTILRRLITVVVRLDPALWYAIDLRGRSTASWIPAALLLALFAFGAAQCFADGKIAAAALLSAVGLSFLAVKLRATAHG